jgi:hypothetical protein
LRRVHAECCKVKHTSFEAAGGWLPLWWGRSSLLSRCQAKRCKVKHAAL